MQRGFSLVELSIVLVILGLLTGGILTGQSLIRASELRSVTSDYQRYTAAVNTFRDKYFAIPGDMTNAESFWGTLNATAATCRDTASTSALTCNGDGDGNIELFAGNSRSREYYRFWQHLANAGLVEGTFSGTWDGSANWGIVLGTNVPRAKISNAGWGVIAQVDVAAIGGWYNNIFQPSSSTHWLEFGGATSANSYLIDALLKTEEAWNIDTKLDDGSPGAGKITTFNPTQNPNCASSATANTATYQLSNSASSGCTLMMGL
jgi:prepilin-type N-terminal cleavage/methylation domain-containing protein